MSKFLPSLLVCWLLVLSVPALGAAAGFEGWIDQTTDLLQAEAGTPLPRILELHQVLEKSGPARQVCASLESNARFNGRIRLTVSFETPDGEPVKPVRFRFPVVSLGEEGSRGVRCKRLRGLEVPEMTVATYRFELRGSLLVDSPEARRARGSDSRQLITLRGLFERFELGLIE